VCRRADFRARARSGKWLETYGSFSELHLEIGCGKGRFTSETARSAPQTLFIAVERVREALVVAMERATQADLKNGLFLDRDAAILPAVVGRGEVDRIYINFCDPWPGKKHAKRRLTSGTFLPVYREILRPGGEIHLKTDNSDLFEYSLEQFTRYGFALSEITRDLHRDGGCGVMTDYEAKFYEQGIRINRCVATRCDGAPALLEADDEERQRK
jgi:tRNA (guanine-N7-)-methyltransferase